MQQEKRPLLNAIIQPGYISSCISSHYKTAEH